MLEISSFYICAPKFTIIWCTVPEIWSETDRIFFSFAAIFWPFSPLPYPGDIIILHICTINNNHVMYDSWSMQCNRHDYLSFWTIFCLRYGACDRQNVFSFWTIFCPFNPPYPPPPYPPYSPKNQNFEKMKKITGDIIILHICTKNYLTKKQAEI